MMKIIYALSFASLMLVANQSHSTVLESKQIVPPPGPYRSIMNHTPPTFSPYGSQQGQMAQGNKFALQNLPAGRFPPGANNNVSNSMPPEWATMNHEKHMSKINEINKRNEKEYLDNFAQAEKRFTKRQEEHKKWIKENNSQMKKFWGEEISRMSKLHLERIENIKNMPDWYKKNMIKQHNDQMKMIKNNPPKYDLNQNPGFDNRSYLNQPQRFTAVQQQTNHVPGKRIMNNQQFKNNNANGFNAAPNFRNINGFPPSNAPFNRPPARYMNAPMYR